MNSETRALIDLAERLECDESLFDEAVHEAKSVEASELNNAGFIDQIPYLVSILGTSAIEQMIRENATVEDEEDKDYEDEEEGNES